MMKKQRPGTANSTTPITQAQKAEKEAWFQAPKGSQGMGAELSGDAASRPVHEF